MKFIKFVKNIGHVTGTGKPLKMENIRKNYRQGFHRRVILADTLFIRGRRGQCTYARRDGSETRYIDTRKHGDRVLSYFVIQRLDISSRSFIVHSARDRILSRARFALTLLQRYCWSIVPPRPTEIRSSSANELFQKSFIFSTASLRASRLASVSSHVGSYDSSFLFLQTGLREAKFLFVQVRYLACTNRAFHLHKPSFFIIIEKDRWRLSARKQTSCR